MISKKISTQIMTILFSLFVFTNSIRAQKDNNEISKWWQEARFGLFIHWGIYSVPAGIWNGEKVDGIGEQIMRFASISNKDYTQISKNFNPTDFNAKKWVALAKEAGMKYIVITAKHHDGFAMYDSDVTSYDIVDATPYGKDIMLSLAEECQKNDIKLCFYYSHRQDWNDPDGVWQEWKGQYTTPQNKRKIDFDRYMKNKGLPQVKELLTKYGPVGIFWYDTPCDISEEQSLAFYNQVKKIQPTTLVCNRVGNGLGDYPVLGDNEIPWKVLDTNHEIVATMNKTWGYKSWDNEWKSSKALLKTLISCSARGANYLLNIGPDAKGNIPTPSQDIMKDIGKWLQTNGEAIYGTKPMIFKRDFPWGTSTTKGNKIYLHLFKTPKKQLVFRGLKNKITSARLLSTKTPLTYSQNDDDFGSYETTITLPKKLPKELISVIELTFQETPSAIENLIQFHDKSIALPAIYGKNEKGLLKFGDGGATENFNKQTGSLKWNFQTKESGHFLVKLYINRHWRRTFPENAVVKYKFNGTTRRIQLKEDIALENVRKHSYPESIIYLGEININSSGSHNFELFVENVGTTIKKTYHDENIPLELENIRVLQIELDPILNE